MDRGHATQVPMRLNSGFDGEPTRCAVKEQPVEHAFCAGR